MLILSNTKYVHERESDTVLNLFGDVGGFKEAIEILVGPLIFYYSSTMFDFSIGENAPVTLKKELRPSGKNAELRRRIRKLLDSQTARLTEKLQRN